MTEPRSTWRARHFPSWHFVATFLVVIVALSAVAVYAGVYNIGADAHHSSGTTALIDGVRERSIAVRARNIEPPADLGSAERVAAGAGLYAEMCTGCHLAPGMAPTELAQGLYPQAPVFDAKSEHPPREQFWVIKHGVKLTAMPAWGVTHDDELVWDMVAFLQKLPAMSAADYKAAVANAPAEHDEMMEGMAGSHEETETDGHADDGHTHTH